MISFIDFFSLYMAGALESVTEFYFFSKFTGKKPRFYHYLLFTAAGILTLNLLMPVPSLFKFLIYTLLLAGWGILFFKVNRQTAALYSLITIEVMQLCYGIFDSLTGILSPILYPLCPKAAGLIFMVLGTFLSLSLSCLCYFFIYKYLAHNRPENSRYVLMILIPLLLIFILCIYINSAVYGGTIILNENGAMINADHLLMLFIQIFCILSMLCIIYAYKKLVGSFELGTRLAILEQERHYQQQYVAEIKARYEKTQSFRHDLKNHLAVIHGLLENQNIKEAGNYLKSLETMTNELSYPCHTGNPVLDILTGSKLGIAENSGIAVSCSLQIPCPCRVPDMDFCIILSNALDNAIRACEAEPDDSEKFIQVSGRRQGDFFLIEVKNSYHGNPYVKIGTGLSNIRSIAKKHNGAMHTNSQSGVFCLSVLLVIPQHPESI